MRILRVRAHDFGKLSGELDLAPGMTVVHGDNEAGKSTWLQAIFAGLCGRRRGAGVTNQEKEFERQHKPWSGKQWRATVDLELDGGRKIEIHQHDLETKKGVAHDADTGRDIGDEIMHDGSVDGSLFLGLNRQVMLSTLVIGQGDIQRLRQRKGAEVSALRDELQRAAASAGGAATATKALRILKDYAREQIGQEQRNSTKPLQRAINRANQAGEALNLGRERDAERKRVEAGLRTARDQANQAAVQVRHCERIQAQRTLNRINRRLTEIDRLERLFPADQPTPTPGGSPGADAARELREARFGYLRRPEEPPELDGPSVEELERQLEQLPDPPQGDRETAPEVAAAASRWRHAAAASRALPAEPETTPGETAEELERRLEQLPDPPEGDRETAPEVAAAASAWRHAAERHRIRQRMQPGEPAKPSITASDRDAVRVARQTLTELAGGAGEEAEEIAGDLHVRNEALTRQVRRNRTKEGWAWCGAIAGLSLAALALLDAIPTAVGIGSALPIIVSGLFIVVSRRSRSSLLDEKQTLDARAAYAEAEARTRQQREVQRRSKIEDARRTLESLGLDADLDAADRALSRLAEWEKWEKERSEWQQQLAAAQTEAATADDELRAQLARRGIAAPEETIDALLDRYDEECRRNARADRDLAAKRQQLTLHLDARRENEKAAAEQRTRRQKAETEEAEAETQLRAVLNQRGMAQPDEEVDALLERYERACRQNARASSELAANRQQLTLRLDARRESEKAAAEQRTRRQKAETEETEAEAQLRAVLSQRGATQRDEELDTLLGCYEEACRRNLRADREFAIERQQLAARLDRRRRAEADAAEQRQQREGAEARFQKALADAGFPADSTVDPEQWAESWLERREDRLGRQRADWERLQQLLDGRTRDDVAAEQERAATRLSAFGDPPPDSSTFEEFSDDALREELATARAAAAEAGKQVSNHEGQLEAVTDLPSLAELDEEQVAAAADVELLRCAGAILETTQEHLEAAQDKVHRMLAPGLREALARRLEKVTSGRYSDVRIDAKEGLEVRVKVEEDFYPRAVELSQGTVDQVYLLLRIALAEVLGDRKESAPLFLDDATVHCDTDRTRRLLDLLLELSEERQIVVFSQEEEVREWAAASLATRPRHCLIELNGNGLPASVDGDTELSPGTAPDPGP